MRISELARRVGVPVGTVKFYLREGLLHGGTLTSATQAQYDESHVDRLALIRVLVGTGGLSLAATRQVLDVIDHPPSSPHDLAGAAHHALGPKVEPTEAGREKAQAVLDRLGWQVYPDAPAIGQLASALDALAAVGFAAVDEMVERYARSAAELAEGDVAGVPTGSPAEAVRYVVTGTILFEPLLLALRRLAQEDASARRFGGGYRPGPKAARTGEQKAASRA